MPPVQIDYEKRREQIKRAQRSHRDRRANYFKGLERELEVLRENAIADQNKLDTQKRVIHRLEALLRFHGIDVPASILEWEEEVYTANVRLTGPPHEEHLQVSVEQRTSSTSDVRRNSVVGVIPWSAAVSDPAIDLQQEAINFVLTLEQPCLYHQTMPVGDLLFSTASEKGHDVMLSGPIMKRAPRSLACNTIQDHETSWTIPLAQLETLLRLSDQLQVPEGKLTPVRVWQILSSHPHFLTLSVQNLHDFAQVLLTNVRCKGFGAVIDQIVFESALDCLFSGSQPANLA